MAPPPTPSRPAIPVPAPWHPCRHRLPEYSCHENQPNRATLSFARHKSAPISGPCSRSRRRWSRRQPSSPRTWLRDLPVALENRERRQNTTRTRGTPSLANVFHRQLRTVGKIERLKSLTSKMSSVLQH